MDSQKLKIYTLLEEEYKKSEKELEFFERKRKKSKTSIIRNIDYLFQSSYIKKEKFYDNLGSSMEFALLKIKNQIIKNVYANFEKKSLDDLNGNQMFLENGEYFKRLDKEIYQEERKLEQEIKLRYISHKLKHSLSNKKILKNSSMLGGIGSIAAFISLEIAQIFLLSPIPFKSIIFLSLGSGTLFGGLYFHQIEQKRNWAKQLKERYKRDILPIKSQSWKRQPINEIADKLCLLMEKKLAITYQDYYNNFQERQKEDETMYKKDSITKPIAMKSTKSLSNIILEEMNKMEKLENSYDYPKQKVKTKLVRRGENNE